MSSSNPISSKQDGRFGAMGRHTGRRGACALLLAVGLALGVLWLGSAPALAAEEEHPYIAAHSLIDQLKPDAQACGVVTDSYGDVYVSNAGKHLVTVYAPSAGKLEKLTEFKAAFSGELCSLAVDSTGEVYVQEYNGQVDKEKPSAFPPTSTTKYSLDESAGSKGVIFGKSGKARAIAVDPANQDLYVAAEAHISSYKPTGELISSTIGEGLVSGPDFYGLDVYGTNGDVYVTELTHGRVDIFNPNGTEILKEITGAGAPIHEVFQPFESSARGKLFTLAVDQSSGDFYVYYESSLDHSAVYEFNAAGGYLSKIGHELNDGLNVIEDFEPADLAVDNGSSSPNDGDVYIASEDGLHEADNLFAFGPSTEYKLEAKNEDTSAGTITSRPAGIECGSSCSAKFTKGETIELKAERKAGFVFAGWSGACSGTGACDVTMSEAQSVTAAWKAAGHPTLKIEKNGEGKVTSEPAGIECGATCEATFEEGKQVTLKAEVAGGSKFAGWTGCTPLSNQTECTVTMSEAHTATATFETASGPQLLKVERKGTGEGAVISVSPGIDCGSVCEALFAEGETVTLQAFQTPGSKFAGWTGCTPLPNQTECTVTMSAAHTVAATFSPAAHYALEVKTAGTGAGSVLSRPAGIDCPSTCTASLEEGTEVTLEAQPEPAAGFASTFAGWSGACAGAEETCKVTMSEARTVTATFTRGLALYPLRVLDAGAGEGTVSSAQLGVDCGLSCPGSIECGSVCEASLEAGTIVELIAIPASDSTFAGWSGACSGAGVCDVTMSEAQSVTATFEPIAAASEFVLQVGKSGDGSGTVTSVPGGIDCGSVCQAGFNAGATVELKAVPDAGYAFAGWSGACAGAEAACAVTMSGARSVTATFTLAKTPLPPQETQSGSPPVAGATTSTGTGAQPSSLSLGVGRLTLPNVGTVKGSEALLTLRCSTAGPCDGALKLTIGVRRGHGTKALVIGHASYSIPAGGSRTIEIALSSLVRGMLRHRSLHATITGGTGVHGTLTLKSRTNRGQR